MPLRKPQLWAIGVSLIAGGFAAKQYLWKKVEIDVQSRLEKEHLAAAEQLKRAHERAKRYTIDPAPGKSGSK